MKNPSLALMTVALLGAFSLPALAQAPAAATGKVMAASAPGTATIAQTVKVSATVMAIDAKTRQATLKGPKGNMFELAIDPSVRNLEQVKVGDQVVVRYLEALTLTLKKDGKELRSSSQAQDSARSAAGERPAGVAAQQVEVTADVIAINAETQTVTLRGPKQVVDLKVRDPQQFKLVKVGDQVQAVYTQALAMSVEPAAAATK